ncbi:MAG: hypothetical protein J6P13_02215 [Kiritimatiellae bacterium]|nr:hypothetical protein [Kiritimatiellia bacterium]
MVVVNARAGQRSNRLVTIAHAMATAIERGEDLRLTAFDSFKDDYACTVGWDGRVIVKDSRMWEWVRLLISALKRLGWESVLKGRIVSDWTYRDFAALKKHADLVRAFFEPRDTANAEKALDKIRADGCVVVGVHVRRGDYKDFEGGRYYYEDDVYERNKKSIGDELVRRGDTPKFVVFPLRSAVEDQWMMSQCDYLMGPPSTFTMWASFMGKVPLGIIRDRSQTLSMADFKYEGLIA